VKSSESPFPLPFLPFLLQLIPWGSHITSNSPEAANRQSCGENLTTGCGKILARALATPCGPRSTPDFVHTRYTYAPTARLKHCGNWSVRGMPAVAASCAFCGTATARRSWLFLLLPRGAPGWVWARSCVALRRLAGGAQGAMLQRRAFAAKPRALTAGMASCTRCLLLLPAVACYRPRTAWIPRGLRRGRWRCSSGRWRTLAHSAAAPSVTARLLLLLAAPALLLSPLPCARWRGALRAHVRTEDASAAPGRGRRRK
jgi:hypothetical protein